jgi:hypothetical protein
VSGAPLLSYTALPARLHDGLPLTLH